VYGFVLNKVILIGRLATEPELKWTPSGVPVTTFRIAVDRPISTEARQSGQDKQTDFIDIVAWRQQAEFASNYLGKGRLVAVEGRLQIRKYVAQDGTNRTASEVVVQSLQGLDRPRETQGGDDQSHGEPSGGRSYEPKRYGQGAPAPRASAPAAAPHGADQYAPDAEVDDPFNEE
jgi:single-strand DNA-binding protein